MLSCFIWTVPWLMSAGTHLCFLQLSLNGLDSPSQTFEVESSSTSFGKLQIGHIVTTWSLIFATGTLSTIYVHAVCFLWVLILQPQHICAVTFTTIQNPGSSLPSPDKTKASLPESDWPVAEFYCSFHKFTLSRFFSCLPYLYLFKSNLLQSILIF